MNRRRLLQLKRAGLLGPRGSRLSIAGGAGSVPPHGGSHTTRSTRIFGTLPLVLGAAFLGVVLWALVDRDSSDVRATGQAIPASIEPVTDAPLEVEQASVPADVPTSPSLVAAQSRAIVTVDVDGLMLRLTRGVAKGPAWQDNDVAHDVQALGVVWLSLSPGDRTRAVQGVADAIVLRRDAPARLRGVVAAMSAPMRDDVFAFLELGSDAAPLPAALFVNP